MIDLTTAAKDLLALLANEGVSLSDDLSHIEKAIRDLAMRVGAKAVELRLAEQPLGYVGSSRACDNPFCGRNQRFVEHRSRTLSTLMGPVTFSRAYYHCGNCGSSCCPYDQRIGLGSEQMSVGLAKVVTLLAALDPFVPAATILHETTGQRLGDRTIHRVARKVGKAASESEKKSALAMATWSVPIQGIEAKPQRLYIAVDGVMVHRDQWNEAKCVACYWEESDGKGGTRRQTRYAVRFESAEQFKAFAWSLAVRCGLESAREVVLLGDGAAWIWEHVGGVLGEQTICITDWYHVMEHLWTCGKALHGPDTPETTAWVKERETLLWEGQYPKLLKQLDEEHRRTRSVPKHQALKELMTYLKNQGGRIAYDKFRTAGYDIGSGRVESACKHVVANRMKRSGMIWSNDGAQELLSLRTAYLNKAWEKLWAGKPLLKKAA